MIKKTAFTLYPIVDVARARRFYEQVLELEVWYAGEHGGTHWVEYNLPEGGCLALTDATDEEPGAGGGTVALEVEDLDVCMEKLRGADVEFKSDVIRGPRCRMAVCLDSEGNSILLHQFDKEA